MVPGHVQYICATTVFISLHIFKQVCFAEGAEANTATAKLNFSSKLSHIFSFYTRQLFYNPQMLSQYLGVTFYLLLMFV